MCCSLAFLKVPNSDNQVGPEAVAYLKKYAIDKVHDAVVVQETGFSTQLILMEEGEQDWSNSLNAYMLADGLAVL